MNKTALTDFLSSSSNPQVIDVKQSSVNMVPSKVEITLRKADSVAWGKLEDPNYKPEPEPIEDSVQEIPESYQPDWDIDDDDISDSDEEWADDAQRKKGEDGGDEEQRRREQEAQNVKRKEVEEEMKRLMEQQNKMEEERRKLAEQRREEEQGGYEDMPDLEDGEANLDE